jgi:hypothetical protein
VSYSELRRAVYYVRLVVERNGVRVYDKRVQPYSQQERWNQPTSVAGFGKSISVRDLNGDGEPEILVDFWFDGAHCCMWTRLYAWDPGTAAYKSRVHFWGNVGYRSEPLGVDGTPELVSRDNRFAYAFTSYAGSAFPVRIWSYRSGRLIDTTRSHPSLVARDAVLQWRGYRTGARRHWEVRGALAAWAADECLIGRCRSAFAWLEGHRPTLSGNNDELQSGPTAGYLRHLRSFLRRTGYRP